MNAARQGPSALLPAAADIGCRMHDLNSFLSAACWLSLVLHILILHAQFLAAIRVSCHPDNLGF